MRSVLLVLVAAFCAVDALPFPQIQFAAPPPPAIHNFVRQSNLMPGSGMRMLSSTYKPAAPVSSPAPVAHHYPSYAPAAYPVYPGAPGHLNINNHNNNDNFNHNSEEAQARIHEESKNANLQSQELNDILAAYSLQNFLQNSRQSNSYAPSAYHREQPRLKEKYTISPYPSSNSGHHSSGSTGHHGSSSSTGHHGSSGHPKDVKNKYLKDKNAGIPKQTKPDYTPKRNANY